MALRDISDNQHNNLIYKMDKIGYITLDDIKVNEDLSLVIKNDLKNLLNYCNS